MAIADIPIDLIVPDEIARAIISPESYADLEGTVIPAGEWLRENLPIGLAKIDGYDAAWLLSKYDDIQTVAKDNVTYHNGDQNPLFDNQADDAFARTLTGGRVSPLDSFSYMDPPAHTGYRRAVNDAFSLNSIKERYEAIFAELAREIVDELMQRDGECDFVQDFAAHYPTRVTMALLGVPREDHARMLQLTKEFFGGSDPAMQREEFKGLDDALARQWAATTQDFYGFFAELRAQRRADPTDDFTTLVDGLHANGTPWPDHIKNGFLATVAPAGIDTTAGAITGAIIAFTHFPEQMRMCKEDPSLISGLVDEAIRWTTPTKNFMRSATQDTSLRGVPIHQGDRMCMMLFSGNRDADQFPDPHRFDVTRRPNRHVAFSNGPHVCLGQHVARLEMRALFAELLPRLKSIELVGEPERELSNLVSNWRRLPVRFTKEPGA